MGNGLAHVLVENWERYSAAEVSPTAEKKGVPVPHRDAWLVEHQCQGKEHPQNLAVKINRDSIHPGETEGC